MAIKYVPIRSERSFCRHKAAGAKFEVNLKRNMRPLRITMADSYWCDTWDSGWITPGMGVEGARAHLRGNTMAVRAVYDDET